MRGWLAAFVWLILAIAAPADAHESRPLYIEIAERGAGAVELRVVAPPSVDPANIPAVALGAPCAASRQARRNRAIETSYHCAKTGGTLLSIDWPAFNPSITTIIQMTGADGATTTALLDPAATQWAIPETPGFSGVAKSYFIIGAQHIVGGIDHLLFLAGLLFIAGTFRRAIITATGFTIAHSLTLCLVALDVIRVSVPAIEAVIALSIVFLAAEIARGDRTTLAWRRPALVACAFGLAHGAGFAAALSEVGLPTTERVAALLFFNFGVEAGQLAIILTVFGVLLAARRAGSLAAVQSGRRPVELGAGYGLGLVSAFWFIERVTAIFAFSDAPALP